MEIGRILKKCEYMIEKTEQDCQVEINRDKVRRLLERYFGEANE